ncbi:mucin-12-like [Physella acuta]|uniref:mucin-12-like n=1 Tax=Physella acuta TaxID=109671 RepID=UPI0027DD36D9|nr:mucin-12-like [Physella acuta]XP_059153903.1 mucin-12-like [Physella acuta]XP_059153904.1 mucin-12-like [Physella acuta]XP_059153905.1 mucin-12-like [Physella acuta]XP_059153906.1 mucin-12-like [Physella acuta]
MTEMSRGVPLRPLSPHPQATLSDDLRLAASRGQVELIKELLSRGAGLDPDKDGRNALHYAAQEGHADVCKLLLASGCEMDKQDVMGLTPVIRATSQGALDALLVLLEAGALVNRQDEHGNAAIHEACWHGFSKAAELLVKHNCDVFLTNKAGFTALHLAAQNGHNESSRVLLYAGCNADLKNNYGDTALHTAARYGHAGVARILISARCKLSEQNKNGDTALHISAALKRRKIAKILVESGIDISLLNKQNETALDVAQRKEHPEIILIITTCGKPRTGPPAEMFGVSFKEEIEDSPVVCPDEDLTLKPQLKQEKEGRRFFFFKKKKKDKPPTPTPGAKKSGPELFHPGQVPEQQRKTPVHGFFSQYVPRDGVQLYRDLAGNIKQGPIGYAPVCQCGPSLRRLENSITDTRDTLYNHMDASHQILSQRIEYLDNRSRLQSQATEAMLEQRLRHEEHACHGRISSRLHEERVETQAMLEQASHTMTDKLEYWLNDKLASYGHCLDHHHDDSALPPRNLFSDFTELGRLVRSRSDETLTASDYSGKFRKKDFYASRQAAMQQIRGWDMPVVDRTSSRGRRRETNNNYSNTNNNYSNTNNNYSISNKNTTASPGISNTVVTQVQVHARDVGHQGQLSRDVGHHARDVGHQGQLARDVGHQGQQAMSSSHTLSPSTKSTTSPSTHTSAQSLAKLATPQLTDTPKLRSRSVDRTGSQHRVTFSTDQQYPHRVTSADQQYPHRVTSTDPQYPHRVTSADPQYPHRLTSNVQQYPHRVTSADQQYPHIVTSTDQQYPHKVTSADQQYPHRVTSPTPQSVHASPADPIYSSGPRRQSANHRQQPANHVGSPVPAPHRSLFTHQNLAAGGPPNTDVRSSDQGGPRVPLLTGQMANGDPSYPQHGYSAGVHWPNGAGRARTLSTDSVLTEDNTGSMPRSRSVENTLESPGELYYSGYTTDSAIRPSSSGSSSRNTGSQRNQRGSHSHSPAPRTTTRYRIPETSADMSRPETSPTPPYTYQGRPTALSGPSRVQSPASLQRTQSPTSTSRTQGPASTSRTFNNDLRTSMTKLYDSQLEKNPSHSPSSPGEVLRYQPADPRLNTSIHYLAPMKECLQHDSLVSPTTSPAPVPANKEDSTCSSNQDSGYGSRNHGGVKGSIDTSGGTPSSSFSMERSGCTTPSTAGSPFPHQNEAGNLDLRSSNGFLPSPVQHSSTPVPGRLKQTASSERSRPPAYSGRAVSNVVTSRPPQYPPVQHTVAYGSPASLSHQISAQTTNLQISAQTTSLHDSSAQDSGDYKAFNTSLPPSLSAKPQQPPAKPQQPTPNTPAKDQPAAVQAHIQGWYQRKLLEAAQRLRQSQSYNRQDSEQPSAENSYDTDVYTLCRPADQRQGSYQPSTDQRQGSYQQSTDQRQGSYQPSTDQRQGSYQPSTDQRQGNYQPSTDQRQGSYQPSTDQRQGNYQPSTDQRQGSYQPTADQRQGSYQPSTDQRQGNYQQSTDQRQGSYQPTADQRQGSYQPSTDQRQGSYQPSTDQRQGSYQQSTYQSTDQRPSNYPQQSVRVTSPVSYRGQQVSVPAHLSSQTQQGRRVTGPATGWDQETVYSTTTLGARDMSNHSVYPPTTLGARDMSNHSVYPPTTLGARDMSNHSVYPPSKLYAPPHRTIHYDPVHGSDV